LVLAQDAQRPGVAAGDVDQADEVDAAVIEAESPLAA
jgi:hypothetical protein